MPSPRIELIGPSGYPHDHEAMDRGVARLREFGCDVQGIDVLGRSELRFAGTDVQRAADLNSLASMHTLPDIALAIRGGYGATRLLEHLHYDALRERLSGTSTVLVGHSDFTAVQMALHAKAGLVTLGGPMLGPDFGAAELSDFTWGHFWQTMNAGANQVSWLCRDMLRVDVEGPLWGGNLAMLCSLLGTPYFPRIDGGILFVEDINEPPFRIERLLYQLQLAGVLGRQKALLLGQFTHCNASPYDNGYDLDAGFGQIRAIAGIPVLSDLPFGHVPDKFTLPFGAPARLHVEGGHARLAFEAYPHLTGTLAENP